MTQMLFTLAVLIGYFWRFKPLRYLGNHGWIGIINFAIVGLALFVGYGHYVATTIGHVAHIMIGFFVDRESTFRSLETTLKQGMWLYWLVEVVSFGSVFAVLYVLVDIFDWNAFLVRVVIASVISTAISYYGNDYVTFKKGRVKND